MARRLLASLLTTLTVTAAIAIARAESPPTCDPDGTIVGDNIGDDAGSLTGTGFSCQRFPDFPDFDIVALDDFTVGEGGIIVTCMDVSAFGFNGFEDEDWNLVEFWTVEIYSSPEAAAANLTGDVASATVPAPLVEPFGDQDLLRFDLTGAPGSGIELAPGTYWVGVIPSMPFDVDGCCGQAAVGGTIIGNFNAYQANPGGGFGFPGNLSALSANLAYRLVGTELEDNPCPWDVNDDGVVDIHDLFEVIDNLGRCDDPDDCPWDFNGDGLVSGRDVAAVATHFGACP